MRAVDINGVTALVGDLDTEEVDPTREGLLSHSHVLEDAVQETTILPMRFGMLVPDEAALGSVVSANEDSLLDLLDRFEGMIELNVKSFFEGDLVLQEIVSADAKIAKLSAATRAVPDAAGYYDRIRLGEMIAQAYAQKRDEETSRVAECLGPLAIAMHSEDVITENMAANLSFLVRRVDIGAFSEEVAQLEESLGPRVRLRYVGPLPPYSFADVHLTAAAR